MLGKDESRFAIGAVERDTGIGRDTLRIWERRYGFPAPERNAKGERIYTAGQIGRLQLIRRLLDQGLRPGKVVPLSDEALDVLATKTPEISPNPEKVDPACAHLIALATAGDITGLNAALEQILARDGLRTFVLDTFAPLSTTIGELWAAGRLQVFEEHLITRHMVRFLDIATSRLGRPPGKPDVLLATLPGERHSLGLLMAEALLWHAGKSTLNLGTDIPMEQILVAVDRSRVRAVALSFSASYPRGTIRAQLEELADRLPPEVTVWIGGSGVRRLSRLPPSVIRASLDLL